MTAEKPEGDVALLPDQLRADGLHDFGCSVSFAAEIPCDCTLEHRRRAADALESQATRIETLSEALERARGCIKGLCARTPVRDVAETLAEIDSALSAGHANPS